MTIRIKRNGALYEVQEKKKLFWIIPIWVCIVSTSFKTRAIEAAERFVIDEGAIWVAN